MFERFDTWDVTTAGSDMSPSSKKTLQNTKGFISVISGWDSLAKLSNKHVLVPSAPLRRLEHALVNHALNVCVGQVQHVGQAPAHTKKW